MQILKWLSSAVEKYKALDTGVANASQLRFLFLLHNKTLNIATSPLGVTFIRQQRKASFRDNEMI